MLLVLAASGVTVPALAGTVHRHPKAKSRHHSRARAQPRPRGPRGRRGATGPTGPTGPAGPPGAAFVSTIVVHPAATAAQSGAALEAAVASAGTPSASDPKLLWIEPGTYDLGTTTLQIPSHVDVQGSGQDITTIEGEGQQTLAVGAGSELRELTVKDTATGGSAEAIGTGGGLADVTVSATAPMEATAVIATAPTSLLLDVTASASTANLQGDATALEVQQGGAVEGGTYSATDAVTDAQAADLVADASATVTGATMIASGGSASYPIFISGSGITVVVSGSTLEGAGGFFVPSGATLEVGGSQVPGVVTMVVGTAECPDDWLASFETAGTDCS